MNCPLKLNNIHCSTCFFNTCPYQRDILIEQLEEFKDKHGNVYVDSKEWKGVKEGVTSYADISTKALPLEQ